MPPGSLPLSPRDALLRRVGRNVVNFQYLETSLRRVIPTLRSEGSLTEVRSRLDATVRKHKRSSLGNLADAFLDTVLPKAQPGDLSAGTEPVEITLRISTQIETTADEAAQHRRDLLKLVTERNRLVHRDFLSVDLDSPEQCEQLSARLDEQNDRIREHLAFLNSVREMQRDAFAEFAAYVQSDEFMSVLAGQQNDAP